jgi:hypothetical protein
MKIIELTMDDFILQSFKECLYAELGNNINEESKKILFLMEDIKKNGLKKPLEVRKHGEKYIIIDGIHRLRALYLLGWTKFPCVECK